MLYFCTLCYLNTCCLDTALLSCKYSYQDNAVVFLCEKALFQAFWQHAIPAYIWMVTMHQEWWLLLFLLNEDLHSLDAKSLMVLWVDCKCEISDHILYDVFSQGTSNKRASESFALQCCVWIWNWVQMCRWAFLRFAVITSFWKVNVLEGSPWYKTAPWWKCAHSIGGEGWAGVPIAGRQRGGWAGQGLVFKCLFQSVSPSELESSVLKNSLVLGYYLGF